MRNNKTPLMKAIISLSAFFFFFSSASAQNLQWAINIGSAGSATGIGMSVDAAGNVYSIGSFNSNTDFDPGAAVVNMPVTGPTDMFLLKLDANGNYIWAKHFGNASTESITGIVCDAAGNIFVCGAFNGTMDFDPGPDSLKLSSAGSNDFFIAKYDPNGALIWAKVAGGIGNDAAYEITCNNNSDIYVTGRIQDTADVDPGPSVHNLYAPAQFAMFFLKLDSTGNFVWAHAIGESDDCHAMCTDAAGNLYSTGFFHDVVDFDPGAGVTNLTAVTGNADIFVLKLDNGGNFVWAKSFGQTNNSTGEGFAIKVDGSGNVITGGYYINTTDFDPGAGSYTLTSNGSYEAFLSKLDPAGNFMWAKSFGSTGWDRVKALSLDAAGNIFACGHFEDTVDFDPGAGVHTVVGKTRDVFVSKFDPAGNLIWVESFGNNAGEDSHGIFTDASGSVLTTGKFTGVVDFDPGAGISNNDAGNTTDMFIVKLNQIPAALSDIEQKFAGNIIPNPATDKLTIEGADVLQMVEIFSATGNRLQTETASSFSISQLVPGAYFLKIKTNKGVSIARFLKL